MITLAFSFLFPCLAAMLVVQGVAKKFKKEPHGWRLSLILVLISGIITLIPIGGISLARWLIGINANFSFPLLAVMLSKAWENASGNRLLDRNASMASWLFGLAAALALYPMALGLGGFDPYILGWGFSWLFVFLAMITIALALMRNRFAGVLIACVLGYDLHLLESPNLWDYLIDPFFALLSFAALSNWFFGRIYKALSGRRGMDGLGRETGRGAGPSHNNT